MSTRSAARTSGVAGQRWAPALLAAALLVVAAAVGAPLRAGADRGAHDATCQRRGAGHAASRGGRSRSGSRGGGRSRGRARAPRLSAAQRRQIQRWHARASTADVRAWLRAAPPPLVLRALRQREPFALAPAGDEGGFDADDLALAERALAARDGATHPIHPRLVELLYRAARHFRAPYVHVVSGYRGGRASSRHAQGRAIDFVLPGVSDRRLAAWLRPQGFVGVGIYPVSGFVHLDVRGRSYFWSDASGPDQPNRERQILASLPARFDAAARRRGVEPVPDLEVAGEVGEEAEADADAPPPPEPVAPGG